MSKKVNLKNRSQIDFLSNRTRVMAELRILRFWIVIVNNLFRIPILETDIIYGLIGTVKHG